MPLKILDIDSSSLKKYRFSFMIRKLKENHIKGRTQNQKACSPLLIYTLSAGMDRDENLKYTLWNRDEN